jgi:hypothetical protein
MRSTLGLVTLAAMLSTLSVSSAYAQSAPPGTVAPAFREQIPNIPGKSLVGVVVSYPPGGKTPCALGFYHRICAVGVDPQPGR